MIEKMSKASINFGLSTFCVSLLSKFIGGRVFYGAQNITYSVKVKVTFSLFRFCFIHYLKKFRVNPKEIYSNSGHSSCHNTLINSHNLTLPMFILIRCKLLFCRGRIINYRFYITI